MKNHSETGGLSRVIFMAVATSGEEDRDDFCIEVENDNEVETQSTDLDKRELADVQKPEIATELINHVKKEREQSSE